MLLKIAWRNIWRSPIRSIVIMLSLMVGLLAGCFMLAFFRGMVNEQVAAAISRQYSHIQIHTPAFKKESSIQHIIPNAGRVMTFIKQQGAVKAVSERVVINAMASTAHGSTGITVQGIVPANEKAVTGLESYIAEGRYFPPATKNPIIIGRKLQEKLKLSSNQKIILTFQNASDDITAAAFRVAGIYTSNNSAREESTVYVQAKDLIAMSSLPENAYHEIAILLKDNNALDSTAAALQKQFPSLQTETWKQLSPELRFMIESFNQYMYIIMGIILLALVFGIINTMLMAVLERQKELGVLMAIGMNKRKIFTMVLMETILMTFASCIIGLPVSWLVVSYFGTHGIDLSNWSQGLALYGYGNIVYPTLELVYYLQIGLMTMVAALLAAVYPARKSLTLHPADAIRKI